MGKPLFFPSVLDLLERFKTHCQFEGWKICGNEDLVNVSDEYHYFVWIQHNHPGTFRRVVASEKRIPLREYSSYRLVNISYLAWISSEPLGNDDLKLFSEIPGLAKRIAVYDLNFNNGEKPICSIIDETDSVVFKEFESFLAQEFKMKLKLLPNSVLEVTS